VDTFLMRNPVQNILKRALVGVCAPKAKVQFLSIYKAAQLNLAKIQKFEPRILKSIDKTMR
jgi:NAD(P)H dehydrogenase (quinone)